jgi:hypothetical protein
MNTAARLTHFQNVGAANQQREYSKIAFVDEDEQFRYYTALMRTLLMYVCMHVSDVTDVFRPVILVFPSSSPPSSVASWIPSI